MYEAAAMETTPWSRISARAQHISARAQHLTHRTRRFVHDRPLQAIALTIAVGFVVGKLLSARDA
jgi:ElaB/YqjD/DUF883 family membrane-anchored ribosome-binding protein